jgi:hypothetical protein
MKPLIDLRNKDGSTYKIAGRSGHFGAQRDRRIAELNTKYGKGVWHLGFLLDDMVISYDDALKLYEESYFNYLWRNPAILSYVSESASEVFDTAQSNIQSGLDWYAQEDSATHLQDIAIRRAFKRIGARFNGERPLQIRGKNSELYVLNPGKVPFVMPDLIYDQSDLARPWVERGTIESFWQNNRVILIPIDHPEPSAFEFDSYNNSLSTKKALLELKRCLIAENLNGFLEALSKTSSSSKARLEQLRELVGPELGLLILKRGNIFNLDSEDFANLYYSFLSFNYSPKNRDKRLISAALFKPQDLTEAQRNSLTLKLMLEHGPSMSSFFWEYFADYPIQSSSVLSKLIRRSPKDEDLATPIIRAVRKTHPSAWSLLKLLARRFPSGFAREISRFQVREEDKRFELFRIVHSASPSAAKLSLNAFELDENGDFFKKAMAMIGGSQ